MCARPCLLPRPMAPPAPPSIATSPLSVHTRSPSDPVPPPISPATSLGIHSIWVFTAPRQTYEGSPGRSILGNSDSFPTLSSSPAARRSTSEIRSRSRCARAQARTGTQSVAHSAALSGTQWHSEALRGTQRHSHLHEGQKRSSLFRFQIRQFRRIRIRQFRQMCSVPILHRWRHGCGRGWRR